ncbi:MAG: hypothetical protein ACOYMB_01910 [Patescibacteria group bacterium]
MPKNEIINIRSDSEDWRGAILSNLANIPFTIGDYSFKSVESALQGIKFFDQKEREEVFKMNGLDALKAGRKVTKSIIPGSTHYVFWNNKMIEYNSIEHRLLIAMFISEKIRQNIKVQKALSMTHGAFIYHDVGVENPNTSLPEKFYIEILLAQRRLLKKLKSIK